MVTFLALAAAVLAGTGDFFGGRATKKTNIVSVLAISHFLGLVIILVLAPLMAEEFNYDMQLAQIQGQAQKAKEAEIEDRKDKRVKIQGTQQSELIAQRQNDSLPKDFESAGNDNLDGFGLEQFSPS